MDGQSRSEQLDAEILDAMGQLSASLLASGEQMARRVGVPAFCLKALELLGSPMAMRDLGRLLHCDPSFVTTIADLLEKRGLARREASTADRRIKNLVLTTAGAGLREQVRHDFLCHVPWRDFDDEERACLLALIRKMIRSGQASRDDTDDVTNPPPTGGRGAGEVVSG
jgi:MarR family transcriptional regulator, organic hydroperoxide resistance regulator